MSDDFLMMKVILFRSFLTNRYLIKNFAIKDLKNRYSSSIFGFIWSVIHPLTLLAVYSFVFSWMLKTRLGPDMLTSNFTLWLYTGLVPWTLFSETISRSTSSILDHSNLIKKTVFPSEILPISILLSNLVHFLIGMILLVGAVILFGGTFSFQIIYLFLYLVPLCLLSLGLGWITAALNVFFRDIGQLIGVVLTVWFYATTIIYPIQIVPQNYRMLFDWNPLLYVIEGFRQAVFGGGLIGVGDFAYLYAVSVAIFVCGFLLFNKTKKGFVDVL